MQTTRVAAAGAILIALLACKKGNETANPEASATASATTVAPEAPAPDASAANTAPAPTAPGPATTAPATGTAKKPASSATPTPSGSAAPSAKPTASTAPSAAPSATASAGGFGRKACEDVCNRAHVFCTGAAGRPKATCDDRLTKCIAGCKALD
jgi:hypothetical protein